MHPDEVQGLQRLALAHGGSLSINPETGLVEAKWLKKLLPALAGAALSFISGGTLSPLMSGLLVGGATGIATGSFEKGLMAGLGAYGGAGLMGGITSAMGSASAAPTQATAQGAASQAARAAGGAGGAAGAAGAAGAGATSPLAASATTAEGATAAFGDTGGISQGLERFIGQQGGMMGAAQNAMLALGPSMEEEQEEAPEQDPGMIRPYSYDPREQRFTARTPYSAARKGMAEGGIAQLTINPATGLPQHAEGPENNRYSYDYINQRFSRLARPMDKPGVSSVNQFGDSNTSARETDYGAFEGDGALASMPDPASGFGPHAALGLEALTNAGSTAIGMVANALGIGQSSHDPNAVEVVDMSVPAGDSFGVGPGPDSATDPSSMGAVNGFDAGVPGFGDFGDVAGDVGGGMGDMGGGGDGVGVGADQGIGDGGPDGSGAGWAAGGLAGLAGPGRNLPPRMIRGPGDGVSDSIPAQINGHQPAALADGEFVVPARIVSELGNGSTEAGARQLYAMMDRIQKRRAKTTGKGRVAVDSKARDLLPA